MPLTSLITFNNAIYRFSVYLCKFYESVVCGHIRLFDWFEFGPQQPWTVVNIEYMRLNLTSGDVSSLGISLCELWYVDVECMNTVTRKHKANMSTGS